MARDDNDKRPLLLEEQEEENEEPSVFLRTRRTGVQKVASVQSELLDLSDDEVPKGYNSRNKREIIVAIFIVSFDTKKG